MDAIIRKQSLLRSWTSIWCTLPMMKTMHGDDVEDVDDDDDDDDDDFY